MGNTIRKEYLLENLDCANCAAKIEREIGRLEGVEQSILDFVTKKLTVDIRDKESIDNISTETRRIVRKFEPDVEVVDLKDKPKQEPRGSINKGIINEDNKYEFLKLCIGVLLLGIGMIFNLNKYVEFFVFGVSYIVVGGEVLLKAINNIKRGQIFDENFLMALATVGAFAIGEFPEGVSVMIFYQIGEFFQDIAVNNSRKSITSLMEIKADYANLIDGKNIKKVNPEEVRVGEIIVIRPGERVPLDGKIVEGYSVLDTSALTGETAPRNVKEGDEILSGCININGLLKVEVIKEFSESTVARILSLVQNASSRKAKTENFITKFARYYTPSVVIIAGLLAVLPPLFISGESFSVWIYRALIFLVVSCPCALVISIPLSFFGGIGGASRQGILIKGSNYLEALNKVDMVIFDKTGTLTKGTFKVTRVNPSNGFTVEDLLMYASYAESFTNHPISKSILKAYNKDVNRDEIKDFKEIPGLGIRARVKDLDIYVGNAKLMLANNISFKEIGEGGTIVYVAAGEQFVGSIIISDEIKESSRAAIEGLKSIGIRKTIMLTGDNESTAGAVARELALDEYYSELLPEGKTSKIEEFENIKQGREKLVFVGDGINDAPVLARADVGIAMGGLGSDAAIEAADIVIMNDDPQKIVTAIKIAHKTRQIVWQNIIFALGVKVIVLAMGAAGYATMWEAVFADVGVALIAVLNAMRAMRTSIK